MLMLDLGLELDLVSRLSKKGCHAVIVLKSGLWLKRLGWLLMNQKSNSDLLGSVYSSRNRCSEEENSNDWGSRWSPMAAKAKKSTGFKGKWVKRFFDNNIWVGPSK